MQPFIICHMISSIDGRIVPDRWTIPVDGVNRDSLVNQYYDVEKTYDADGWIIGRATASEHFVKTTEPWKGTTNQFPREPYVAQNLTERLAIFMTRTASCNMSVLILKKTALLQSLQIMLLTIICKHYATMVSLIVLLGQMDVTFKKPVQF